MHFTPKDWIFPYFSLLGVGKLILAGLYIRRCRWHRRKIYRRCRWHRWTVFRRCRLHRRSTLICEYLREFSKKFKTAPMEYLWAWGALIHEKTWARKSRVRLPLKVPPKGDAMTMCHGRIVQGKHRPRDASSKGRNVQGTQRNTHVRGHIGRGRTNILHSNGFSSI